jgi:WD40 repeat protein
MLALWRHALDKPTLATPFAEAIASLAFSPSDDTIAAVGYASGAVVVLHTSPSSVTALHRMRGHTAEVQSISWCPGPGPPSFATGSRDRSVRLWTAAGAAVRVLPQPAPGRRGERGERPWTAVCWSSPDTLVAATSGSVLAAELTAGGPSFGGRSPTPRRGPAVLRCALRLVATPLQCLGSSPLPATRALC